MTTAIYSFEKHIQDLGFKDEKDLVLWGKKYAKEILKQSLEELFEECKHGDQEHQDWLENKFKEYLKNKVIE